MLTDKKLSYKIISVLKLHWPSGSAYAGGRPYHALSVRLEGDAEFECGNKSCTCRRGDLIYIPKGRDYTITAKRSETVIVVHFDIFDDEGREIELIRPSSPEITSELFMKMHAAWEEKRVGYEYRIESLFARVMEGLMADAFREHHGLKPDLSTLLDFIHANFQDPSLTVASLAKRIGVSPAYLRRSFGDKFGTSPIKYLTGLRLSHAKQLLEAGYHTIEEVAKLSGYNDPKYFSTAFKRAFGVSPGAARGVRA